MLILLALLGCGSDKIVDVADTAEAAPAGCPTAFSHSPNNPVDEVRLIGDWSSTTLPMTEAHPGDWSTTVWLEPGVYTYRFEEGILWEEDMGRFALCDPQAPLIQCEDGTATNLNWEHRCAVGVEGCASLVVVDDCTRPRLKLHAVAIDREAGRVVIDAEAIPAIDGEAIDTVALEGVEHPDIGTFDGRMFHVEQDALGPSRHPLVLRATDALGRSAALHIPVWMDDFSLDQAVMYHALVDRVFNGDPTNDALVGTTHPITDWAGGDFEGLAAALPYLDSLGVNLIWLSNPWAAPADAWPGDCDASYAGFHGFWPTSWDRTEARLGAMEDFVDAAHARGMRVIVDWVGNHVHADHPQAAESDWFHPEEICKEAHGGESNWDRIPEECWFTPYLPDLDHSQPEVLHASVQTAIDLAQAYGLDGLRVDAAKHMSHAVSHNLASRVEAELEHRGAGSDFEFYLVGETFDGAEAINAYVGPDQLDGQFDFPGYWAIRAALITDSMGLDALVALAASLGERYPGGRMSTFLGNLDVERFITAASEYTGDVCVDGTLRQAAAANVPRAYDRLQLAFTLLFTQPGIPLIYYGDEIGTPGYGDPDNRQPLWWHAPRLAEHDALSLGATLDTGPAAVLDTVRRLAKLRAELPVLAAAAYTEWWRGPGEQPGLYAYAKTDGVRSVIVILNRSDAHSTLNNGLSYAGLPVGGVWMDALSDAVYVADGDALSVEIAPWSAAILVAE